VLATVGIAASPVVNHVVARIDEWGGRGIDSRHAAVTAGEEVVVVRASAGTFAVPTDSHRMCALLVNRVVERLAHDAPLHCHQARLLREIENRVHRPTRGAVVEDEVSRAGDGDRILLGLTYIAQTRTKESNHDVLALSDEQRTVA